jgi:hypothetical protein
MEKRMKNTWTLAMASIMAGCSIGAAPPAQEYAEGQVWEYRTRPEDEGSLLKMQKIEMLEDFQESGPVYHVSLIGLRFADLPVASELQHAPFSKASLDASVTRLSGSKAPFPDPTEGIAEWRAAKGGVFTISVAEAVSFTEQTIRPQMR